MKMLESKIRKCNQKLGMQEINVASFLNHQLDVALFRALGKEIHRRFARQGITKILTIEASGIAIATITSMCFDLVPVVFAKKSDVGMESEEVLHTQAGGKHAHVAAQYLSADDRILILDDIVATGATLTTLVNLVEKVGAEVCGIATIIEQGYDGGGNRLRQMGYHLESIVTVESIQDGEIQFRA